MIWWSFDHKKSIFSNCNHITICRDGSCTIQIDNLSISYGEEIKDEKGKIVKIIGEANDKIYALGLKGKKDYFLKIFSSKEMKLLSNNPIILPEYNDKDLDFEEVELLNNKLYLIGSVFNRKEKAVEFSENGKLSDKSTTLFESKVAKSADRGGFYFKKNNDENKLLYSEFIK